MIMPGCRKQMAKRHGGGETMTRLQWRKVHRWIFIFMGFFMLAWLVSGILMLTPRYWFGELQPQGARHSVDYSRITLSPADIISRLDSGGEVAQNIDAVTLRKILDHVLYQVRYSDGHTQLFDARTGQPFEITVELAEALARDAFPSEATLRSVDRIEEYDLLYTWGSLPVYRLRFEDHPSVVITVVPADARVMRLTPMMGIRQAITGLHEFEPVKLFTDSNDVRRGLLIITGAITLLGTLIGIYLIFPFRRKDG